MYCAVKTAVFRFEYWLGNICYDADADAAPMIQEVIVEEPMNGYNLRGKICQS
jgi:hypothetical protein